MALKKGSPAMDAGVGPGEVSFNGKDFMSPDTDQRGRPRSDKMSDLGAFEHQLYSMTVTTAGDGDGVVTVSPEKEIYDEGTEVILSAVPAEDTRFAGWSGDATGEDHGVSVIMDHSKKVVATFLSAETIEEIRRPRSVQRGCGCSSFSQTWFVVFLFIPAVLIFRK